MTEHKMPRGRILIGDVREQLRTLPERSMHCCVTSPPYWGLRDYGVAGQIGLESTPAEFVRAMVDVFSEVWRVLRDDGTCWVNLGDSFANDAKWGGTTGGKHANGLHGAGGLGRGKKTTGLKPKDLVGIPWRVAFALQEAGWYLRQDIIWAKPSPMPESVRDRCTKSHEYIFLLAKSERYYFDQIAVQERAVGGQPGNKTHKGKSEYEGGNEKHRTTVGLTEMNAVEHRNLRDVWRISTRGFKGAHFATFPPELPERCIKAGTSERGCCPTCGAPWRRVTEKQRVPTRPGTDTKITGDSLTDGNRDPQRHITRTITTGWVPTCKCPAHEPVPCVVLDPFFGSGTTGLMAEHLGRDWVGCELNPEYAEMARQRIAAGYTPPKTKSAKRKKRHLPQQLQIPGFDHA